MAYQTIGRGTSANDGTGDDLRTGAGKVNANFVELYTKLGDGSTLTTDTVVLLAETQTLTNKTLTAPTITGAGAIAGVFTGNITGDVTGNITGDVTGNVTGDLTGDVTGDLTGAVTGSVQALSGAGAVDVTNLVTEVTTTGTGDALTLVDGTAGQVKIITYVAEGAGADTAILTPTTLNGGTTVTFNNLGDAVTIVYGTGGWTAVGVNGATIA